MITLIPIMLSLLVVLIFRLINQKYQPPIFGIYQRRNKYFWFKFVFMYLYLRIRQLIVHVKGLLALELGYSYDGTVHIQQHDIALEQKQDLRDGPLAVDAVYFNGMSKKGDAVICGIARRPENNCDAFMYLKIAGEDLLLTPSLPDTRLTQSTEEEDQYSVQGMSVVNFIPMRTWKLSYNGEMKSKSDPEKKLKVEMDLTWSAKWHVFNYDIHMSPLSMAKDLARERWSRDYFKNLAKFHQTHYEQMGYIEGSVSIDGNKHELNMPCVRDHTKGTKREWRNFHRYVLHFMFLENENCICVGVVSQPVILSHLTIGYMCRKSDQAVLPVKYTDFQLWQHAENGSMPKDYGFVFKAGGERYDVQVESYEEDTFYIGQMREAKFHERWSRIDVNGVKGWACVEWQFNNAAAKAAN